MKKTRTWKFHHFLESHVTARLLKEEIEKSDVIPFYALKIRCIGSQIRNNLVVPTSFLTSRRNSSRSLLTDWNR